MTAPRSGRRAAAVAPLVALVAGLVLAGCGGVLAGGAADDGDAPSAEAFLADAEAYLAALEAGELEAAWDLVCHDGFGASDRADFDAHHAAAPRPVAWDLAYETAGAGTGRSAGAGGAGGTPSGAAGTVELSDGTRGEIRLLYGDAGLCEIVGDDHVARAVDPSPGGGSA